MADVLTITMLTALHHLMSTSLCMNIQTKIGQEKLVEWHENIGQHLSVDIVAWQKWPIFTVIGLRHQSH